MTVLMGYDRFQMFACQQGHVELVKLLLERGGDANLQDDAGRTVVEMTTDLHCIHLIRRQIMGTGDTEKLARSFLELELEAQLGQLQSRLDKDRAQARELDSVGRVAA